MNTTETQPGGEILLYQTEDGKTRLEVQFQGETVWLTQKQMAELFQKDVRTISEHIRNVYEEGELTPEPTLRNFRIVQSEGKRQVERDVAHYNLDVVISVGYRVKSHRGVQFRIWATQRLREYLVKGFALDDERLKRAGGGNYFDELLARIRDIRSSEKMFWRKVLDIYATSIDYDPAEEVQFQGETVWLSHAQMVELFQTTKQNVSLHIQNIYDERELERTGTVKESLTVRPEGARQVSRDGERPEAATCKFYLQVRQQGGLGKVHQLFGDKLNTIIEELNETLAA